MKTKTELQEKKNPNCSHFVERTFKSILVSQEMNIKEIGQEPAAQLGGIHCHNYDITGSSYATHKYKNISKYMKKIVHFTSFI